MNTLDSLSIIALIFVVLESYLTANKLWSRKHKEDVAESISLTARFISVVTLTTIILDSYMKGYIQGYVSAIVWLAVVIFQVMVGSGLWIKSIRGMGLISRLKLYTLKESSELSNIIKGIINPSFDKLLAKILANFALVDSNLDKKEKILVDKFTKEWKVDINWEKIKTKQFKNSNLNIIQIRQLFNRYLDTSPPRKQVLQFSEILNLLVLIDGSESEEEKLMMVELTSLMNDYLGSQNSHLYDVTIVPQTEKQRESIPVLITALRHVKNNYGDVFVTTDSYSRGYAEILCEEYRGLGFVSLVINAEQRIA